MTIEAVIVPDQPSTDNRVFKLVVSSDGFAEDFRRRVQKLLQDAPPGVEVSFADELRRVIIES